MLGFIVVKKHFESDNEYLLKLFEGLGIHTTYIIINTQLSI